MGPENSQPIQKPNIRFVLSFLLPLGVFLTLLIAGLALTHQVEIHHKNEQRHRTESFAENQAKSMERFIHRSMAATYALGAVVRDQEHVLDNRKFETLSEELLKSFPGITNLQLAPGGIIGKIHPLAGNEPALGHNLLADPLRNKEAHLAVNTGKLTLAGPFPLIQGGVAVIGRYPVFVIDNDGIETFWGFTTAVMQLSDLLAGSGLPQTLVDRYAYELWRLLPDTGEKQIFARSQALPINPVSADILVPNGNWTLSISPLIGWESPPEVLQGRALSIALALLGTGFIIALMRQPQHLQRIVEERTRALEETNDELLMEIHERQQAEESLVAARKELERRVIERTAKLSAANLALTDALAATENAIEQLIQSEKLAALGGLVAGVAHEINTPVGVGVTAVSYLEEMTGKIIRDLEANRLKKSSLEKYLSLAAEATHSIHCNLRRASEMIHSFKQVAVDQSSEGRRRFDFNEYLDEILLSLRPKLKKSSHQIRIECPQKLEIDSYPGAFSQILSNLLFNSFHHAFDEGIQGEILIRVSRHDEMLQLHYGDNGRGMDREMLGRIFDPFYTTKRGQGGSGLGMHIVYNLVTRSLGGKIFSTSAPGKGTSFDIIIPLTAPAPEIKTEESANATAS